MIKTAVLTISDRCAKGQREDMSGQTITDILKKMVMVYAKGKL
jgi:molybdopterin biosynthesis enzyme MoaB